MERRTTGGRLAWVAALGCLLVGLVGCESPRESFSLDSLGLSGPGSPLERDLARALRVEGRVECMLYVDERDLWRCSIEHDPGSGFSRSVSLHLGKNGCWRARYVRFEKGTKSAITQSDLSVGEMHPVGRAFKGCTELE